MKIHQVVITGKEQVSLETAELDEKNLGPDELFIETESTFISAGTELANYTGIDKRVYIPGSWCSYPSKSGYTNVGVVRDAGEAGKELIGKRVFTYGQHASHLRYSADRLYKMVVPVPEGLSSEEAVAVRMAQVAMAALDASKPQYMRWVIVFGMGMVGNLAAQLFRLTGAQVIAVEPSKTRRHMARDCGIPYAIKGSEEEILAQVNEITDGKLAQVTVDAVGHSSVMMQALDLTAKGGEVIALGSPREDVEGNLTDVFAAAFHQWITIKGCLEWNMVTDSPLVQDYTQRKKLDGLYAWLADGRLQVKPMITHVLPPTEIKTAYEGLLHKKEEYVGVVLNWKG